MVSGGHGVSGQTVLRIQSVGHSYRGGRGSVRVYKVVVHVRAAVQKADVVHRHVWLNVNQHLHVS